MSNPILARLKKEVNKTIVKSISPSSIWLKGTLLEVEEGYGVISYQVRKEMTNPFGTIQGGILAAMIDDTMGLAFLSLNHEYLFTTTNLHVNYLYGAKEGEELLVKARVMRMGKKISNIECMVYNEKGEVICTATSNLVITSLRIDTFN